LGLPDIEGVYIAGVRTGGAADDAGVEEGDVVLAVNGSSVDAPNELQSAVARYRPGETVQVTVWRDGEKASYQIELMGRNDPAYEGWLGSSQSGPSEPPPSNPDPAPAPDLSDGSIRALDAWGIGVRPLQSGEPTAFGVDAGVYIAYVEKDTPADAAGLPRDVVLTAVNGSPVASPDDVQNALDASGTALLRVQRRDGTGAYYEVIPSK
jgi:S1-C subfamily serine protease